MIDYDKLKKDTYLFLLENNEDAKELAYATLLISLCHDKCIKDNELMVSSSFIKKCNLLVPFETNYEKMCMLSDEEKISLIRNKLAHGDFVYNEKDGEIYFKHYLNGEVILSSIKLKNVITFAKEITRYYDFLSKKFPREKIVIYDGLRISYVDNVFLHGERTEKYNETVNKIINSSKSKIAYLLHGEPEQNEYEQKTFYNGFCRRHFKVGGSGINMKISVSETDEENKVIQNPTGNSLVGEILLRFNNENNQEYNEVIDLLVKFYIIFIYPLENFLKKGDKNVFSLQNEGMFDFSLLDIGFTENNHIIDTSKPNQYINDLNICYQKLGSYHIKLEKLRNSKRKNIEKIEQDILDVESEIDKLKELFCNNSVKLIYGYSKNRSVIEHLRCSMMHGNYSYDKDKCILTFSNIWQGKDMFSISLTLREFKSVFNNNNINHIVEHFSKVYGNEKIKVKR